MGIGDGDMGTKTRRRALASIGSDVELVSPAISTSPFLGLIVIAFPWSAEVPP